MTLDTNVLIAYVISKHNNSVAKKVVTRSITDDRLMLTDIIRDECLAYTRKPGARVSWKTMDEKLKQICQDVIELKPIPCMNELLKKYKIRDPKDMKILYSVDMTDSVIIVTYDDDFLDGGVEGIKARIMHPKDYLEEVKEKQ